MAATDRAWGEHNEQFDDRPEIYLEGDRVIYRASSLMRCVRSLVAARQQFGKRPPTEQAQARMDQGTEQEPLVIAELERLGWTVHTRQELVEVPVPGTNAVIRGHTDGRISHPDVKGADPLTGEIVPGGHRVLEVKAFGAWSQDKWAKEHIDGFDSYAAQTTVYGTALVLPVTFAVTDRDQPDTGQLVVFEHWDAYPMDIETVFERVRLVEALNAAADAGDWPECDKRQFPCGYFHLFEDGCSNKKDDDEEAWTPVDDTELAELAAAYERARVTAKATAAEQERIKKLILAKVEQGQRLEVGGYRVGYIPSSRSSLDKKAVEAAGIDLGPFTKTTTSYSIHIEARA